MENTDASSSKAPVTSTDEPAASEDNKEKDNEMEEVFKRMEEHGNNTVDNLIKWMVEAQIVVDKAGEEAARILFEGAEKGKVKAAEFNEVLERTAEQQSRDMDEFMQQLKTGGKKFLEALRAGAKTFQEHLEKHKKENN